VSDSFFQYPVGADDGDGHETPTFLAQASDEDWATILAHGEVRTIAAGETLVAIGDVDRSLYVVIDGTLEAVVAEGRRGRDQRISVMEAGTVVGEIGFLDGRPRSAAVRAVTDATLLRLTLDQFEALAGKQPAIGRSILFDIGRVLASRLRDLEHHRRGL
jgi:CRP/FNR family cyclic AMP-dependent transcriptional regulator